VPSTAVHTITGCDYTSKLGTKHTGLKANPETYLKDFGKITSDLAIALSASEGYITQVLKKGTAFEATCTTMEKECASISYPQPVMRQEHSHITALEHSLPHIK
jgi:hypothetical protein